MEKSGYFLLDRTGYIMWAGTAPNIGSVSVEAPAVELVLGPDRQGYYVMNANGKLWRGGGYIEIVPSPPTFNDGRVRSFAITPDYRGTYVLDKNGRVYTGGTAKPLNPATPVFAEDIALKIKLTRDGKGYYILDRYGRVHNGGSAPALTADFVPHMGEDWARDLELTEDESGYYLLDKFGGIHTGGTAFMPTSNLSPVWSDGSAVDLQLADTRSVNALVADPSVLARITTPTRRVKFVVKVDSTSDAVAWRASADQSWLKIDAQVAVTPGEILITADPGSLTLGTHRATITISGDGAANSPLSVPVQLRIVKEFRSVYLPSVVR